jgi:hypothetical protein
VWAQSDGPPLDAQFGEVLFECLNNGPGGRECGFTRVFNIDDVECSDEYVGCTVDCMK